MRLRADDLAVPAANGNSDELDASPGVNRAAVYVTGTFVADVQVQVSPLATGDVWLNESTALSAPGSVMLSRPALRVRCVVSTYVSGTPVGTLVQG